MSWLISQALMKDYANSRSLRGPVAAFSEENSWDGEPSARLNVMPTQHKFWRNDKTMEFSSLSRFGLTLHLLTESRGEELLTWFLAGFPVRTCPAQEQTTAAKPSGLMVRKADCGGSLPGSLARYDPATHSLKTAQISLIEDLIACFVTLPRWGLMRNGAVYPRKAAAQIMSANESGLLPTPTTKANQLAPSMMKHAGCRNLHAVIYPTPTAHNAKEGGYPAEYTRNTPTLGARLGGRPHPQFNEWMMAWPLGWTDLNTLATAKFQEWLHLHGEPSVSKAA